MGDNTENR